VLQKIKKVFLVIRNMYMLLQLQVTVKLNTSKIQGLKCQLFTSVHTFIIISFCTQTVAGPAVSYCRYITLMFITDPPLFT
jgi:hypothetical protein